ncbi:hypothetical protein NKH36_31690 [Mesorhizobium sp. M1312]|uniref:hypothetical protein n=1 Tax=unclassified Mesorhizobium TaxID=325217 RepID=UPI003336F483
MGPDKWPLGVVGIEEIRSRAFRYMFEIQSPRKGPLVFDRYRLLPVALEEVVDRSEPIFESLYGQTGLTFQLSQGRRRCTG